MAGRDARRDKQGDSISSRFVSTHFSSVVESEDRVPTNWEDDANSCFCDKTLDMYATMLLISLS